MITSALEFFLVVSLNFVKWYQHSWTEKERKFKLKFNLDDSFKKFLNLNTCFNLLYALAIDRSIFLDQLDFSSNVFPKFVVSYTIT